MPIASPLRTAHASSPAMKARIVGPELLTLRRKPRTSAWVQIGWRVALAVGILVLVIVIHWLERDGGSLLVSTSRRTPAWLRSALRHRFAGVAGRQWHGPADGENPYPGFLAHATRIVVSADSSNLLSEAAAVGVPVLVHGSARGKLALLYRELLQRGHGRPLTRDYQPWTVEPLRELPRVAAQVNALLQRR